MLRFVFRQNGSFNLTNTSDGSYISGRGLDINILHDADNVNTGAGETPQDGGINVSTYAGTDTPKPHTGTFAGRTASGTAADPDATAQYQALVEFSGKGYDGADWEHSNRGVFGVYAAQLHTAPVVDPEEPGHQGAYCAIQTTRIDEDNDHFSMVIDQAGNAGLTDLETGLFATSLPLGFGTSASDRYFSIESSDENMDAGLLIQNGGETTNGTIGLNLWFENTSKVTYFDNIMNDANAYVLFRLKTKAGAGSQLNLMSITATGMGMGGNTTTLQTPASILHIDKSISTATASEIRWTAGSATGTGSGDGLTVGITSTGVAEIRQKENLDLLAYTNNTLLLSLLKGGYIVSGNSSENRYRTTNGGGNINAHLYIDPTSTTTTGAISWGFDQSNGFFATMINSGAKRVMGMAIQPTSTNSGATTEAMGMAFLTQSAGGVATSKLVIEPDGRIYGTGLHNNGTVTGTTTQFIASGTFTPTITASTNTDAAVSATQGQWMRVGNVVTVSGRFTADPTTGGITTSFESSFPIASNIGNVEDCGGVSFCGAVSGQGAEIIGVVTNDTAIIQWIAGNTTSQTWSYSYTYEIK